MHENEDNDEETTDSTASHNEEGSNTDVNTTQHRHQTQENPTFGDMLTVNQKVDSTEHETDDDKSNTAINTSVTPNELSTDENQVDEAPETSDQVDTLPSLPSGTSDITVGNDSTIVNRPPAVIHHVDYKSKAEERKAELEALRRRSLAKPQSKFSMYIYIYMHVFSFSFFPIIKAHKITNWNTQYTVA